MEKAIQMLSASIAVISRLLLVLIVLGMLSTILFPTLTPELNIATGIGNLAKTIGDGGFSGFIAFLLFICIFKYVSSND